MQRQHALDVRVQKRADARELRDFGRVGVEAADRDDLRSRADGEEDLGDVRHERNDPLVRRRIRPRRHARVLAIRMQRDDGEQRERGDQRFRMSSHKKNGPPMSAVMIPTGRTTGAISVRDMTSHPIRNAAPNSADAGSTMR